MKMRRPYSDFSLVAHKSPLIFFNVCLPLPCKHKWSVVGISMLILMSLVSSSIRAQGTLTLITKEKASVSTAKEITCIRKSTRPPVAVHMNLMVGDRLVSDSRNIKVRVGFLFPKYA